MAQRKQVEIDEETHRRLRVLAAQAGLTIKEFVRLLVDQEWGKTAVSRET